MGKATSSRTLPLGSRLLYPCPVTNRGDANIRQQMPASFGSLRHGIPQKWVDTTTKPKRW